MKQKIITKWNKLNWRQKLGLQVGGGMLALAIIIALLGALGVI